MVDDPGSSVWALLCGRALIPLMIEETLCHNYFPGFTTDHYNIGVQASTYEFEEGTVIYTHTQGEPLHWVVLSEAYGGLL